MPVFSGYARCRFASHIIISQETVATATSDTQAHPAQQRVRWFGQKIQSPSILQPSGASITLRRSRAHHAMERENSVAGPRRIRASATSVCPALTPNHSL